MRNSLLPKLNAYGFSLVVIILAIFFATDAQASQKRKPPNIIFILADDLGWAELGCYGSTFNETPHLDKLAKQGMRFTQAYAAAPVCSPTRVAFMTGQYPARVGITDYLRPGDTKHLSPDYVTIAERLKAAGYVTGLIGKWHLTGYRNHGAVEISPDKQGFDEVMVSENRGIGAGSYFFPYHFNKEIKQRLKGKEYLVDRCHLEAVEFIERHKERPFFLFLSHYAVHTKLVGKPALVEKYAKKKEAGKSFRAKRNNPHLAAQLESIDNGVGMIMQKLAELGLADNTLLIFTSDNGGESRVTINGILRAGKSTLYEGGVRVPLIARWPNVVETNTVCQVPTMTIDYYPTFLEAAGLKANPKHQVDGLSLLPLLREPDTEKWKRDTLYWHYPLKKPHFLGGRSSGAIRKGDFKLVEDFTTGKLELFNLKQDPGERKDLAPMMPAKVRELHEELQAWRKEVGARITKHQ